MGIEPTSEAWEALECAASRRQPGKFHRQTFGPIPPNRTGGSPNYNLNILAQKPAWSRVRESLILPKAPMTR
jgi:hypothetical protein